MVAPAPLPFPTAHAEDEFVVELAPEILRLLPRVHQSEEVVAVSFLLRILRNNRTILDLYSREYYVQYINYINFTIRLADVGLRKGNCSSLPHRSLSCSDSSYYSDRYRCGKYMMKKGLTLSKTLAIVDCKEAVNSQFYIDSSSCLSEVKFSDSSSTRRRVYAMVDVNVSYVEAICTIEHMAMIPWWVDGNNVRSYVQIHELMVYGFELSWLPIACGRNCYRLFISWEITGGLKDKLGEGGYGSVFKGRLRSGREVAVKILKKGESDGQDFISEVATIGRNHHVNVVELIGFCFNGSKQALVYDFTHNGSLDKHIFSQGQGMSLDCKKLYKIALGIARGIEYLHRGITPKVFDFGLARLCPMEYNIVSLIAARGNLGYMAPELVYKNLGGVSYKADVYSFGKLLMEMATRRKNEDNVTGCLSHTYFPLWVHDQLNKGLDIPVEYIS
ncbi:G-type lectin S-receptor-like serine/threonine-protein kinase SD1-1 [Eucalyptus grandis]|uniref:G-type lectin S-receptor-like serine/threonine-protein kinase SD1-1 n=1 Tax=Eucalyptus grandis TaxID=71139 RepID=UPI00192E9D06|nr:G-type lectin S-receptor-like serine/threonine-protein kinase SD1-1 [Eucalyptus grandis]